jgi:hypothetical protein
VHAPAIAENLAVPSRKERLKIFLARLEASSPASNADDALKLLSTILNAVEDEFSGIPFNPESWIDDGRMYPPTEKNRRAEANPSLRRYRSARHNTYVGVNGSIRIEEVEGVVCVDKAGLDGRRTIELSPPS